MRMPRALAALFTLASVTVLVGWSPFHIELNASFPEADQEMSESPAEMWLEFSVPTDLERSSFSVRGPEGSVDLGEVSIGDSPSILRADVMAALAPGKYTVSWVAAPMDDHAVRGRYAFTVASSGTRTTTIRTP